MTRSADISRQTNETDIRLAARRWTAAARAQRTTGIGFFDHMLDAVARHGGLDLDVAATGDLETGLAPHGRGRRDRARPGARRGARRPRRDHPLRPGDGADGRGARHRASSTCPAGRCASSRASCPRERSRASTRDLAEEFFRAVAGAAKLTLHVQIEAGTNAHHMVEAAFKAFARALRAAVEVDPDATGHPVHEGPAVIADPRLRHGQPALGREGARARRGRGRGHARRTTGSARPTASCCRAWARSRRRWRPCGELGFDALMREHVDAGKPALGICLGMQLLFESSSELGGADGLGLLEGEVDGARRARA